MWEDIKEVELSVGLLALALIYAAVAWVLLVP
jgi:hypothetical protein